MIEKGVVPFVVLGGLCDLAKYLVNNQYKNLTQDHKEHEGRHNDHDVREEVTSHHHITRTLTN
jgi:hypothetical protein